ncbi:hypothetical protein AQUCO_08900028v1 [Aquilegia coerulea]|uniref:Uncharacterized protein n=1 Tax=Aquilegia coerulea TaxID=218851 RepID=A0A2G5C671_AQUCA|nr:hypothetical protein AQUCO_08900028v1 [Aquilegia coerulea]
MHGLKQWWQHFRDPANLCHGRTAISNSTRHFPTIPISPYTDLWLQSLYSPSINLCKFLEHTPIDHQIISYCRIVTTQCL